MTFWEFGVAIQAWTRANTVAEEAPAALTEAEHDALMAKHR